MAIPQDRDSPLTPSATGSQSVAGVTPTAIGPEEEERRLRMSQAVGKEDAVSERLTQRKRRKKRTRKHSSKPSERLPYHYCTHNSSHTHTHTHT